MERPKPVLAASVTAKRSHALWLILGSGLVGLVLAELTLQLLTGSGTIVGFRSNVLPIYEPATDGRPFALKRNFHYATRFYCARSSECAMDIVLNDMGVREDRSEAQLLAKAFKIMVMGDSFTFGYGVNQGERYSDLLNTVLGAQATAFSVGYADGYSPVDYEVYLRTFYDRIRPDLVVVGMFPENDLGPDVRARVLTRNERHEIVASSLANGFRVTDGFIARSGDSGLTSGGTVRVKNWLWERFALYRMVEAARNRVMYRLDRPHQSALLPRALFGEFPAAEQPEIETTLGAIRSMDRFLKSKGSTLVVLLIPSSFQISARYDEIYDRPGYRVSQEERAKARKVLEPQTTLAGWFSREGIRYLDPTQEFLRRDHEGAQLYFENDGHWTPDGHRVAFQVLADYLLAHELIPARYLEANLSRKLGLSGKAAASRLSQESAAGLPVK